MSRTPQDVFDAHFAAVARGDVDAVLADYSTDAVVMTVDTVLEGHGAIRSFFTAALGMVPEPRFTVDSTLSAGDAVLVTWSVTSPSARIRGAVDTFVVADDKIRLQTTVFTLEPVGAG
jgi:ketosteroid isomerase-like protein